jgi:hypothetical protein
MPSNFEQGGKPVDLETVFERLATDEERLRMLGSLAFLYEMKVPILFCPDKMQFYPIDWQEEPVAFDEHRELVILQSDRILPSIFRTRKKEKQVWTGSIIVKGGSRMEGAK